MAAARKRKSEAACGVDEADRALYSAFCGAANSLSHLYSQSVALQKHAFRAGELHALEKFSQWILKHAEESRLTVADIMAHIQHEVDYGGSDTQSAPRVAHQYPQSAGQLANSGYHQPSTASYIQATGLASQGSNGEQSKSTAMSSNALSSPVRQKYHHPTRGGWVVGNGGQNTTKDNSDASSNETVMDMV